MSPERSTCFLLPAVMEGWLCLSKIKSHLWKNSRIHWRTHKQNAKSRELPRATQDQSWAFHSWRRTGYSRHNGCNSSNLLNNQGFMLFLVGFFGISCQRPAPRQKHASWEDIWQTAGVILQDGWWSVCTGSQCVWHLWGEGRGLQWAARGYPKQSRQCPPKKLSTCTMAATGSRASCPPSLLTSLNLPASVLTLWKPRLRGMGIPQLGDGSEKHSFCF